MRLVLDASIAIAALRPKEPSYQAARARLRRLANGDDVAVIPSLFLAEVAGALARLGFDPPAIDALVGALTALPHEVVTVGPKRALAAARIAVATKLRGADATYVWLAAREGVPVCTLDREILARGVAACQVLAP
ncbi:MAG: type II toxin-antitoxin system VapC family toxin [Polyangiaceae bacterium]